ncbi:hypothetical protein PAPYR_12925 [Paratrimastix pyriformis]|uniref:Uncharacterized protein n=1 Tax=Paratrimastix pyriformis TaxID=342808 RepID=A0ABQ8U144_9EUKA|nr:hypothetical protein PAPYR_12925 [Paratrimastix pyriformis]
MPCHGMRCPFWRIDLGPKGHSLELTWPRRSLQPEPQETRLARGVPRNAQFRVCCTKLVLNIPTSKTAPILRPFLAGQTLYFSRILRALFPENGPPSPTWHATRTGHPFSNGLRLPLPAESRPLGASPLPASALRAASCPRGGPLMLPTWHHLIAQPPNSHSPDDRCISLGLPRFGDPLGRVFVWRSQHVQTGHRPPRKRSPRAPSLLGLSAWFLPGFVHWVTLYQMH